MKSKSEFSTGKRFGPRYGGSLKNVFAGIEKQQRSKQLCQYCRNTQVKRIAAGIWECRKCKAKFTGRAYTSKLEPILTEEEQTEK
ncbi:50S ribosomal protein L37ae [Candidatus Woesearchaeota archaeon]|nr:50S ribosomal protein L37ae [Candidatus Woesearchaeota archaeon]